jgi:hypothetical protein
VAISRTLALVGSEMRGLPDSASDTVASETPANRATSRIRTAMPGV